MFEDSKHDVADSVITVFIKDGFKMLLFVVAVEIPTTSYAKNGWKREYITLILSYSYQTFCGVTTVRGLASQKIRTWGE